MERVYDKSDPCSIHFAPLDFVNQVTYGAAMYSRRVTFKSNCDWEQMYSSPSTVKFTEKQSPQDGSSFIDISIELFYPGEHESIVNWVNNVVFKLFLVKIAYSNGAEFLIGGLEYPCQISSSYSSERGGRVIVFSCKSPHAALVLE